MAFLDENIKGQLKQDIIEIFTTIKDNYEEWRIKNYETRKQKYR